MTDKTILEICCGDPESVSAARSGGASRIELCCGLADGGLTPSAALVRHAVTTGIPEINVLIRPRPGDFLYSTDEISIMEDDIASAIDAGATGIVTGALTPEGGIDMETCRRLVAAGRNAAANRGIPVNITFHRAFDLSRDAAKSIDDICSLGFDCLLTSGMSESAESGIEMLRHITDMAGRRITVMAGSGINVNNAARIILDTGVKAIHTTARGFITSKMIYRRPGVPMGSPGTDEYRRLVTSPEIVAKLCEICGRQPRTDYIS